MLSGAPGEIFWDADPVHASQQDLASADVSSPAEMSAIVMSSRALFRPHETTLFIHRSLAGQLLTSPTSNRHLPGTVYAIGRLGRRCK